MLYKAYFLEYQLNAAELILNFEEKQIPNKMSNDEKEANSSKWLFFSFVFFFFWLRMWSPLPPAQWGEKWAFIFGQSSYRQSNVISNDSYFIYSIVSIYLSYIFI